MAKSIADARQKWEAKTATAGQKWKDGVSKAEALSDYQKNLCAFVGDPSGASCSALASRWQAGVQRVGAGQFQSAIAGKGAKWEDKTRRGITGR